MNRIHIEEHLTTDQLREKLQRSNDTIYYERWLLIWYLTVDHATIELVAKELNRSTSWCYYWIKKYNDDPSLLDKPRKVSRHLPQWKIDQKTLQAIKIALKNPAEHVISNGREMSDWIKKNHNISVSRQTGWRLLKQCGFPMMKPGKVRKIRGGVR